MTIIQQIKQFMYMVIRNWLLANETIVSDLPGYEENFTKLDAGIGSIESTAVLQQLGTKGATNNKKSLKAKLAEKAYDISCKLVAFANNTGNIILLGEISHSKTDLSKSTDSGLVIKSRGLYNRANANIAALTTYGITAEELAAFLLAINAFDAAIPAPQDGINATAKLLDLFKDVDKTLDNLDIIMEIVRSSQPEFYSNYKLKRKLPDPGSNIMSLKVVVKDEATGIGISGVTVRITLLGSEGSNGSIPQLIKKTADKGGFNLKLLPPGMYKLVATKNGYVEKAVTVAINDGEMTEVEIVMKKAEV